MNEDALRKVRENGFRGKGGLNLKINFNKKGSWLDGSFSLIM